MRLTSKSAADRRPERPDEAIGRQLGEALLAATPRGILAYGEGLRCLWANEAAATLVDTPVELLLETPLPDLDALGQGLASEIEEILATGRQQRCRLLLNIRDGSVWLDCQITPVELADGQGLLLILDDVSEQHRMEESLRLTQISVDRAADSVFWMEPDGRLVFVSDSTCRELGYSREELLGRPFFEIDPSFPKEAWPQQWQNIKSRKAFTFETVHQKKSGEIFPVEVTLNYIEFGGREYNCVFARDITGRKKLEESLRLTQFSVDHAADSMFWVREDGNLIYANDATCRTLGYTREELLSMTVYDVDPHAARPWKTPLGRPQEAEVIHLRVLASHQGRNLHPGRSDAQLHRVRGPRVRLFLRPRHQRAQADGGVAPPYSVLNGPRGRLSVLG